MSSRGGLVAGFLGLTALEALVTTQGASDRVSSGMGALSTIFTHLADPTVPAIPDLSGGGSSSSASLTATPSVVNAAAPASPSSPLKSPGKAATPAVPAPVQTHHNAPAVWA